MFRSARKVIGLASAEKLNTAENHVVCKPDDLDILITEKYPDDPVLKPFQDLGIEV